MGYPYEVLDPVVEETGLSITPVDPTGNASGLRDIASPQLGPVTGPSTLAGRKRAATSAASGSVRRAPISRHLASAADFSPHHFDEPVSDDHIPTFSQHHPPLPSP